MEIEFDSEKNKKNTRERKLLFARVAEVDFDTALIYSDTRKDYGETRYIALCYLDQRLHVLVFSETERGIRVISFRKANSREAKERGLNKFPVFESRVACLTSCEKVGILEYSCFFAT